MDYQYSIESKAQNFWKIFEILKNEITNDKDFINEIIDIGENLIWADYEELYQYWKYLANEILSLTPIDFDLDNLDKEEYEQWKKDYGYDELLDEVDSKLYEHLNNLKEFKHCYLDKKITTEQFEECLRDVLFNVRSREKFDEWIESVIEQQNLDNALGSKNNKQKK